MEIDDKQFVLASQLDEFRRWPYEALAAEIARTRAGHDCLAFIEGVFADGTAYQMEFNVFWDDKPGGDLRVCADLTTEPRKPWLDFLPVSTPDITDSFIMRSNGSFVDE